MKQAMFLIKKNYLKPISFAIARCYVCLTGKNKYSNINGYNATYRRKLKKYNNLRPYFKKIVERY